MIPLHIEGATIKLMPIEHGDKPLYAREVWGCMVSKWEPTPDELDTLNKGGAVELWIKGTMHPPVFLAVAEPVFNEEEA